MNAVGALPNGDIIEFIGEFIILAVGRLAATGIEELGVEPIPFVGGVPANKAGCD